MHRRMKEGYDIADYDGMYYHKEDVEWGIWPDHETGDPGLLVPKANALPVSSEEATEIVPSEELGF